MNFSKTNLKKVAEIALLIVFVLIFFSILKGIFSPEEATELRVLMCFECKNKTVMEIIPKEIARYKCPKDGNKLGFAYKCRKCDYEFPLIIPAPTEKLEGLERVEYYLRAASCPNCGSDDTYEIKFSQIKR